MIPRRLLFAGIVLGAFASACTAIVLGKIGDTADYQDNGASSSGGTAVSDECSLLAVSYGSDRDANACSECITTSCKEHVEYACNRGNESEGKKPWFADLSDCAKNPWIDYGPPGSGASFYDCKVYDNPDTKPIASEDEAAKKRAAEICVRDSCLTGELPACKLCEVHTKKPGVDERALLRDDPCGKCLSESCLPDLVRCCSSDAVRDFVEPCAYTVEPDNLVKCRHLGAADAGANTTYYDSTDRACLTSISACFKANCAALPECQ